MNQRVGRWLQRVAWGNPHSESETGRHLPPVGKSQVVNAWGGWCNVLRSSGVEGEGTY